MLGHVEYQTPNAIDPGERAPSRPTRKGGSASTAVADVPSVKDVRKNAALLLQATEEIPINTAETDTTPTGSFLYDASDNRNEDYDDEGGKYSSSLPSVEEARMYAGRILSARSTNNVSPASMERARLTDNHQGKSGVSLSEKYYFGERRKRCYVRCLVAVLVMVLAVVIIDLTAKLSRRSGNGRKDPISGSFRPGPQHSERLKQTIAFLDDYSYSSAEAMKDPTSPQFMAAAWISDYDLIQYLVPIAGSNRDDISQFIERYVMAVFFYATGGPKDWVERHKFMSEEHLCAWFSSKKLDDGEVVAIGVSCDIDLRIDEILIPKNKLVGSLPTEMGHLEKMHFLDLKDNELDGSIPDELERWTNMEFFDVRRNGMGGTIPHWIGENWKPLKELGLAQNFFSGTIPPSMSGLHELRTLSLSDNEIQDSLSKLYGLTQLEYLYLDDNMFTGNVDSFTMRDFDDLVQFDISSCNLEGDNFPTDILTHPKLEVIDFSDNNIKGTFPEILFDNKILRYLSLAGNDFTGTLPGSIDSFYGLHHLDISGNNIKGTLPMALSKMHKLMYLFAGENPFDAGPLPEFLSKMTLLRELCMSGTNRNGILPDWISEMKELVLLDVSYNRIEGNVPESLWELPELSYLLLHRNKFSGDLPSGVGKASNMKLLLLDKNDISGDLLEYCDKNAGHQLTKIIADCDEVSCDCCDCCSDHEHNCNDDIMFTNLGFNWQHNYTRVGYAFSPEILFGPVDPNQVEKLKTVSGVHS